jgi:hypothetical protein
MQTKDFPCVIAVKKSTQPLIEQYKNMMDTEQKTNMPQMPKQILKEVIATLDVYGCGAHHPDLLPLLDQPKDEPVAIYQYQMANGSWIDQDKQSYDYNVRHGEANVRIVYKHSAPFTPITADMVTDEVVTEYFAKTKATDYPKHFIAAAVNAWGAKK